MAMKRNDDDGGGDGGDDGGGDGGDDDCVDGRNLEPPHIPNALEVLGTKWQKVSSTNLFWVCDCSFCLARWEVQVVVTFKLPHPNIL